MKKLISVILCILLLFSLCACNGEKIVDVKVPFMESEIYSQEDISLAISTITEEFKKNGMVVLLPKYIMQVMMYRQNIRIGQTDTMLMK